MATSPPPLHHTTPRKSTIIHRTFDLIILILLLCFLLYRLSLIVAPNRNLPTGLFAFLCESWFTLTWILTMNCKWSPLPNITYPNRLLQRFQQEQLPAVDMFVTTADPVLEPPIITINTVLSLLAVDYPANRLACYVSDDGKSPLIYYALGEAVKFAKMWVPFCKKYNVHIRAPFMYFSNPQLESTTSDFILDWKEMKCEYEELCGRVEGARDKIDDLGDDVSDFSNFQRGDHPSLVKILWENKEDNDEKGLLPHIIYVAREKRPKHPHHYKAGAMNVLTRVSGVMTNAPFMLNVDCDMFANNPKVIQHAMCLLLGFGGNEVMSGFVQFPQHFHGGLKDDPFGNQLEAPNEFLGVGLGGLQGPFYAGTGCFHRRKVIYGSTPQLQIDSKGDKEALLSYEELKRKFGSSIELIESTKKIMSNTSKDLSIVGSLLDRVEVATDIARCNYELNSSWGKEIGWIYGSMTEDVLTGLKIHSDGWRSAYLDLDPHAFLGNTPTSGPETMVQYKRWATGLLEILVGRNSPLSAVVTKKLQFRQCGAYVYICSWALRSIPELIYSLLSPYCLLANSSFLPKASDPVMIIPFSLLLFCNLFCLWEYLYCKLTFRTWWNNQRMSRIMTMTSFLFGFIDVVSKTIGLSETAFAITRKDQNTPEDGMEVGRFTFDSSPLFVPATAVLFINMVGLGAGLGRMWSGDGGSVVGEVVCCVWMVVSLWPLVRGLFGKGSYGLPWITIWKGAGLGLLFLQMCFWTR